MLRGAAFQGIQLRPRRYCFIQGHFETRRVKLSSSEASKTLQEDEYTARARGEKGPRGGRQERWLSMQILPFPKADLWAKHIFFS